MGVPEMGTAWEGGGGVGKAIGLAPAELAELGLELADAEHACGPDVALCGAVVCSGWDARHGIGGFSDGIWLKTDLGIGMHMGTVVHGLGWAGVRLMHGV